MNRGPLYELFFSFAGGLNDTVSEVNVQPDEASVARNINLERDGAMTKRLGADSRLTSPLSGEVGMIHPFSPFGANQEIVVAYDDAIGTWDGGAAVTELENGLSGVNEIMLPAEIDDLLYLHNGTDVPLVYWPLASGSPKVYRAGTPQPGTAPTDGGAISGDIVTTGDILVRVRFYSIYGQHFVGEPTPEEGLTVAIDGSGGRRINLPSYSRSGLDYRVAGAVIERTTVGGGIFYIDGYSNSGTYDITQSDAALLESGDIAPDLGMRLPPPKLFPFMRYGKRIIGFDPQYLGRLVWSEIDEFGLLYEAFPETNYIILDLGDNADAPAMLLPFGEYAIAYCGKSVHMVYIDEAGAAYARRIGGHQLGFPNARCGLEIRPGEHIVYSYKGPYHFDGRGFSFIGERIEGTLERMNRSTLEGMFVVHRSQERRRQVKFVIPADGIAQNNLALIYHYPRPVMQQRSFPLRHAWTVHDGFKAKSGAVFLDSAAKTEVEYSGDYDGGLFREDTGGSDDHHGDGSIEAEWITPWLSMRSPHLTKHYETIWVFVTGESPESLQVSWETSFGRGPSGSASITLADDAGSVFDTGVFDVATFALEHAVIKVANLGVDGINAVGKFIRFRFANLDANAPFTVVGYIVKYNIDRDRDDEQG